MNRIHLRNRFYFIFLVLLILVYILSLLICGRMDKWSHGRTKKSSVNLTYVTVHLDLKGSPPKMTYLMSLLPIIQMYGANSILIEYEDMFPYENSIHKISSGNCYNKEELLIFLNKAKLLNMEVIPLVQTFGHMEHVLKLKEFAHLREQEMYPTDICPSNPSSIQLITTMLEQVINFHTRVFPLKYIHIGCDEVKTLNKCPKCRQKRLKNNDLYLDHVKKVSSIVKKISSKTQVLIWADMLQSNKKELQTVVTNTIDVVYWTYSPALRFPHTVFYNLHKQFNNIWIASAFKGADGENALIPNITIRFQNNLNWMKYILNYKFGGENEVYNFKGIILTGWSRYTHMARQCELLPVSMPSLILNLLIIKKVREGTDHYDLQNMQYCDFYKKYLMVEFEKIFQSYGETNSMCSFENTKLYKEHTKLFDLKQHYDCLNVLHSYELLCSSGSYMDIYNLERSFQHCNRALKTLVTIKQKQMSFMNKYYNTGVIKSYIGDTVDIYAENIKRIMNNLKNCSQVRYWKRRP